MSAYEVRQIDELEAIDVKRADITWRPVRRAVEHGERPRKWAIEDDDLASLYDDPEFLAITRQTQTDGAGS